MKRVIFYLTFSCISTIVFSQHPTETIDADRDECPDDPYFLLFSDEFDGTTIDTDKWHTYYPYGPGESDACMYCRTAYDPAKPLSKNKSDQVYKDENVVVSDGVLKIITRKDPSVWLGHPSDYSSGMICTKSDFSYGSYLKWEARIKLPADYGLWPAFWGHSGVSEIDFMEVWNSAKGPGDKQGKLQFTAHHWNDDEDIQDLKKYYGIDLSSQFHVYTTEYDPLYVRFYLDGVLMHTVKRLIPTEPKQDVSCNLKAGTYLRNVPFPEYGHPMRTIVSNGIERKYPPGDDFVSATMEVDYVRIYARGCPWAFWNQLDQNITEDKIVEYPHVLNYNYIHVADGKTLTIRNTTIQLNDYGTVTLGHNSKLILDNAIMTSCNPYQKWNGIVAGKNAVIEMKNHSVIEKAYKGIRLGDDVINGGNPAAITDNPTLIMNSNSIIRNCDIGIHFAAGRTVSTISGNAKLANNKTAILAMSSTGLVVDNTFFLDNGQAIRAMDSYLHVRDGNYFDGGTRAIFVTGTYPAAAGIDIGDAGRGYNYFVFQDAYAIDCSGAEHPAGANVVNCRFSRIENGASAAVGFYGANQMMFENNTVGYSDRGLLSRATGDNFNYTQCNIFDNTTVLDVAYTYDNNRSQFLGNQSAGLHAVNYFLLNATMPNNIGSAANPAGNCFSGDIPDITTMSNTQSFNYHFYDESHTAICEEPFTPGSYTKVPSAIESGHCQQGVGIFGLIDPDGDGVNGFLPSTSTLVAAYSGHLTKSAVRDRISQSILAVVSAGGDDPRTLVDETVGTKSVTAFEKEAIADQWIRYAVMRGMDEGDYAYAESVLNPLKQIKWQHHLFGLKLWQAKYTEAQALLATLPARNTDEAYFREVQATNLKRLDGLRNGERFTSQEMSRLEVIARSTEPSSAYARSLYYVLTGDLVDYALPDPGAGPAMTGPGETVVTGVSTGDKAGEVRFYPNPVTDELHVESAKVLSGVEIIDMTGRVLLSRTAGGNSAVLNTARLPRGIYVVRIENSDGDVIFDKMMKL